MYLSEASPIKLRKVNLQLFQTRIKISFILGNLAKLLSVDKYILKAALWQIAQYDHPPTPSKQVQWVLLLEDLW